MSFWKDKKIIVTGGSGFLGAHLIEKLKARGCENIFVPRKKDYDLTQEEAVKKLYGEHPADMVIHMAAAVGGIGANRDNPGKFYYDNLVMGAFLMEQARQHKVPKFVALGTICSYPKFAEIPFKEDAIWDGYPEETNAPYGLAKKMLLVQAQSYREQYGYNAIVLFPVNLYGPHDNFNMASSHVIPALIRKCLEAKEQGKDEIVVWGTGQATREFLYAEDAAEGILLASEKYDGPLPVNLGAGFEISIKDLVGVIVNATGFKGKVLWDDSKPDGQPRRMLDVSRAKELFGFQAQVPFEEGIRRTIEWYTKNQAVARN